MYSDLLFWRTILNIILCVVVFALGGVIFVWAFYSMLIARFDYKKEKRSYFANL